MFWKFRRFVNGEIISDVNKDLTFKAKDQDKDQAYKDKDQTFKDKDQDKD